MQTTPAERGTEGAIWSRLLQPAGKVLSLEAARSILRIEFTREDKDRMHELAAKAREGTLTPAEQEEIRNYERVGNWTSPRMVDTQLRVYNRPGRSNNGSNATSLHP